MTTLVTIQHQSKHRHRNTIRDRAREDIIALEREIAMLDRLMRELRHDRLSETIRKPLTPEQTVKRAERDRKRAERVKDIQASARKRITDIRAQIGQ